MTTKPLHASAAAADDVRTVGQGMWNKVKPVCKFITDYVKLFTLFDSLNYLS